MMKNFRFARNAVTAMAGGVLLAGAPVAAMAGAPFSEYSCRELWHERNGIYANKGYCFETDEAIAVFGRRCYPPFGELNAAERRTVDEIRYWEQVKGCTER